MIDNKTIRKVVIDNKLFPGGSGETTYVDMTASGSIATFETNVSMPLNSCKCIINPLQEGTGTPSPSNPRPISGTSVLNVEQRGANLFDEDSEEGWLNTSTGSTYTVDLGRTVYGGSAEVVGGTGEETYGIVDLGSLEWTSTSFGGNPVWRTQSPDNCKGYDDSSTPSIYCEKYKPTTVDSVYQGTQSRGICIRGATDFIYVTREDSNSPTGKLVYELATPTDFTFEGEEIKTLVGEQNFYHDGNGDIEVSYKYQTGTGASSKVNKWMPIFYPIRKEDT